MQSITVLQRSVGVWAGKDAKAAEEGMADLGFDPLTCVSQVKVALKGELV
jgi:hypothetical protein